MKKQNHEIPGQGKSPKQYKEAMQFFIAGVAGLIAVPLLMALFDFIFKQL